MEVSLALENNFSIFSGSNCRTIYVDLPKKTETHSNFASVELSAKTVKYKAVSIALNCKSEAVMLKSGLDSGAIARRSLRAATAWANEMVSFVKWALVAAQIVLLKLWLSPEKVSARERDPSCSITDFIY